MNTVWLALLTGLTTGGISCFAVQGGLLASSLTKQDKESQKKSVVIFLTFKLVTYTLFGILLGLLGSRLIVSPAVQGWMQILAGIFMIITVGKLLDLHPFFRKFTITPPKSVFRLLRAKSLNEGLFAPGVLGSLTVLIPCGVTQSMMLLSVAAGNWYYGGLILGAFVLGTTPIFYLLGIASGEIVKRQPLKYIASTAILALGLLSINTGQILRGSVHTFQNYIAALTDNLDESKGQIAGVTAKGVQEVDINVASNGYTTSAKTLKVGVPVNLKLITNNVFSCARAFVIPEYGISQVLPVTGKTELTFTPTKKGRLAFSCSMGMYTGFFNVI